MKLRLLVFVFASAMGLCGQDTRGKISGTITDPQGAQIVGAAVTLTNADTNVSTPLTTNESGYYEAPLLIPGGYRVTVEAPGFKKTVRSNLVLTMREQIRVDIGLEVGAVSESIT